MFQTDPRIGIHIRPEALRMACWRRGEWAFHQPADKNELFRLVADTFGININARPVGRGSINLAFDGVLPEIHSWPSAWRGALRVADADFRGVVGVRVLERLGRPLPQIQQPPTDIWQAAQETSTNEYRPNPRPNPDEFFGVIGEEPVYQEAPTACPNPIPDWEFAYVTALVLAPWTVLLDQTLPEPVRFTYDDLCHASSLPRFALEEEKAMPAKIPDDPRFHRLQKTWSTLFNLAQECLNLDGYDLDDSLAVRMLIDTSSRPIRGFTVEQGGTFPGLLRELAGWIEELDGELSVDAAGLRVQTVELDRPRLPEFLRQRHNGIG